MKRPMAMKMAGLMNLFTFRSSSGKKLNKDHASSQGESRNARNNTKIFVSCVFVLSC